MALHEPLLAVLFSPTSSCTGATQGVETWDDDPTEGSTLGCSDGVGYRTYTFGGAVVTTGTVVALRYASMLQMRALPHVAVQLVQARYCDLAAC
eukprot:COSAG02_NODE_4908_length_4846_cov_1.506214_2_plen_94_part_00